VLYDFFSHTLAQHIHASASEEEEVEKALRKKRRHQFAHIVCHNEQIPRVLNNNEIKLRLGKHESILRKQYGASSVEKDCAMIDAFVGWAQTTEGHFVMVYYVGPDQQHSDSKRHNHTDSGEEKPTPVDKKWEMERHENWKLVSKDHLPLFHSRLGRDHSSLWKMSSLDVVETSDGRGNLSLDARFLVNKWLLGGDHLQQWAPLLWSARHLFSRPPVDYTQLLHRYRRDFGMEEPSLSVNKLSLHQCAVSTVVAVETLMEQYRCNDDDNNEEEELDRGVQQLSLV
jgi:hypothetical protein